MHLRRPFNRVSVLLLLAIAAGVVGTPALAAREHSGRQNLTMWFWGAPPSDQAVMQKVLIDGFDSSQSKYSLSVTFNNAVDKNVQVSLAANQGTPDVVYGSGPSFVSEYVPEGKLANMDAYSKEYGWKNKILAPIYQAGTVKGSLYALPNSLDTIGIFYNKAVLAKHGWPVPKTIGQLESDMDKALKAGLYASVTGNKGWRPVNLDYVNAFLTHEAGPQNVYKALKGQLPWTAPPFVAAVNKSAQWFQKGYLAGKDYPNLNFDDAAALLAKGKSPFFIAPALTFQFLAQYFKSNAPSPGNVKDVGWEPFPSIGHLPYPLYTLGTVDSLSINAHSPNKDGAAKVINYIMSPTFMKRMTAQWPGYWGVPLKTIPAKPSQFQGLSRAYVSALIDMTKAVNAGRFGYSDSTFFPPATQTQWVNVDTVWYKQQSAQKFLASVEKTFKAEKAKGLVPPIPAPVPAK
jgi:raffinose/stachyose/melibiose transport system substrate-binding protein